MLPAPIKILFLGANPSDTLRLRLGEEVREIDRRLQMGAHRDRFQLEHAWAPTLDELTQTLLRHKPTIIHFSGHGSPEGELLFVGGDGKSAAAPGKALARALGLLAPHGLRCVVLNACYSAKQAPEIAGGVDYVVGTSDKILDKAGFAFTAGFYTGLAAGESLKSAFELGRVQIELLGIDGSELLREHARPGVDPAALRLV